MKLLDIPDDVLSIILSLLQAKDIGCFAATSKVATCYVQRAREDFVARHAKEVVNANSLKPDHFDASSFKRNLRMMDAGMRKARTTAKTTPKETRAKEFIGLIVQQNEGPLTIEQVTRLSQLRWMSGLYWDAKAKLEREILLIKDKLRRHEDEIFFVGDGSKLSEVEIVSDAEEEEESDDEDDEGDGRDDAGEPFDMDGVWSLDEGESDME